MAKKILVAVDESTNSMKAVEYVAKSMQPSATVALFGVLPDPAAACGLDSPSLTPVFEQSRKTFCAIEDTKKDSMKVFTEKAKQVLIRAGFPSKNVSIKIRKKKAGIARDILREARQGKYDTLVVGRRGLSGIKQFLFGSVSNKVVQLAREISVIVVD